VSQPAARAVDQMLRRLVPALTALAAAALDLLPLPSTAPQSLAPFATVCVFAYWTLFRPELMTPLATFAVGLVLDAAGGLPPGLTPLALLLARSALLTGQRFLVAQPFPVLWGCFVLTALAVELLRWSFACAYWGRLLPVQPVLFQTCLTVAFYPLVVAFLSRLDQHLVRPVAHHAARS
jgi:rod shape-determining protein MreD